MNKPRLVILKVISRYLTDEQNRRLIHELAEFKRLSDSKFLEILKNHFDFERWCTSPLIKQDLWLYNYFAYEYRGKLKCTGLLRKYIDSVFVFNDAQFFTTAEKVNSKKTPLPKGVKFEPRFESGMEANYLYSEKTVPKANCN